MPTNPFPITDTQYEELVAAILRAVPEIQKWRCAFCDRPVGHDPCIACGSPKQRREDIIRPITLEDILRTFDCPWVGIDAKGTMECKDADNYQSTEWTLGLPLDQQSAETKAFLHSLLC